MKNKFVFFFIIFLGACSSPRVVTMWKVQYTDPPKYNKIMVIGLIKTNDNSAGIQMEDHFVKALSNLKYNVVPASAEFGVNGLAGLREDQTYLKLCNKGIDAVITVTLIDGSKEAYQKPGNLYYHPASYYYSRIWNYRNIQADLSKEGSAGLIRSCFWEVIVYDLCTLEAACTIQSRVYLNITDNKVGEDFARRMVQQMIDEKVLSKKSARLKPF